MAFIDDDNYICRRTHSSAKGGLKSSTRNWWLIKYQNNSGNHGVINLGTVSIPKQFVGKRIRFKIEEVI